MPFQGDPTRGLRSLRTQHQDRADQIAALDEIERIGGFYAAALEAQQRTAKAEADAAAAIASLTETQAKHAAAQQAIVDAGTRAVAVRHQADQEAAAVLSGAQADAAGVQDAARRAADGIVAQANADVQRIMAEAKAAIAESEAEHRGLTDRITKAQAELAELQGEMESLNKHRRRLAALFK